MHDPVSQETKRDDCETRRGCVSFRPAESRALPNETPVRHRPAPCRHVTLRLWATPPPPPASRGTPARGGHAAPPAARRTSVPPAGPAAATARPPPASRPPADRRPGAGPPRSRRSRRSPPAPPGRASRTSAPERCPPAPAPPPTSRQSSSRVRAASRGSAATEPCSASSRGLATTTGRSRNSSVAARPGHAPRPQRIAHSNGSAARSTGRVPVASSSRMSGCCAWKRASRGTSQNVEKLVSAETRTSPLRWRASSTARSIASNAPPSRRASRAPGSD